MSKLTAENTATTPAIHGEQRQLICLECAYELDALAVVLPNMVPNVDDAHGAYHIVRGMAARLRQLASILMSAIDDDAATNEDLERVLLVRYASRRKE